MARTIARRAQIGKPGRARAAVPAAKIRGRAVRAARGGSRSAAESSSVAPSTCTSDEPNMLTADSSGDSVAR
ncbi:hypothetical protein QFZ43_005134 [Streptomyces afghaniensis]|nr:hypothetical protein [Streptomyces afghaniensis]